MDSKIVILTIVTAIITTLTKEVLVPLFVKGGTKIIQRVKSLTPRSLRIAGVTLLALLWVEQLVVVIMALFDTTTATRSQACVIALALLNVQNVGRMLMDWYFAAQLKKELAKIEEEHNARMTEISLRGVLPPGND